VTRYHYYLSPPSAASMDTIFVVDARDQKSAGYLTRRLGCERITRREAFRVDRCHRQTGRGSAWAHEAGRVRRGDDIRAADASDIERAADATLETVEFYREQDEIQACATRIGGVL